MFLFTDRIGFKILEVNNSEINVLQENIFEIKDMKKQKYLDTIYGIFRSSSINVEEWKLTLAVLIPYSYPMPIGFHPSLYSWFTFCPKADKSVTA